MQQRNLVPWAREVLTASGVVLVVAFFLGWIGAFGESVSGASLAWDDQHWLFLVPISGLALAALARGPYARLAAIGAGLLVAGNVVFEVVHGVLTSGLSMWLVLGGAGMAFAGISNQRRSLRVLAGIAILAGFFAPWNSESMFASLRDDNARALSDAMGLHLNLLWLVGIGGVVALAAAGPRGQLMSALAGVLVLGSLALYIGSALVAVFAWGAWITLGASATALVVGITAPDRLPVLPGARAESLTDA